MCQNSLNQNHESIQSRPKVLNRNPWLTKAKFTMEKPNLQLYPFDNVDTGANIVCSKDRAAEQEYLADNGLTYPDFMPWKNQNQLDSDSYKLIAEKCTKASYLNKGFFEEPVVSNEYYSARNIVHSSLFSSNENCKHILQEISQNLVNAYKMRNEVINKIRSDSSTFKVPPRVTLTALKREIWLRDLGNINVPFLKIATKIPHGMKFKVLVDTLANKNIPLSRAIWFTKCVLYSEMHTLRKRASSKQFASSPSKGSLNLETLEIRWIQDWTQQLIEYISKFSKDMVNYNSPEKKQQFLLRLSYVMNYTQALYLEKLVDGITFMTSCLKLLKEDLCERQSFTLDQSILLEASVNGSQEEWIKNLDLNYGQKLVGITLIKIFWNDIIKFDYIAKELSESLLLNYHIIQTKSRLRLNSSSTKPISVNELSSSLVGKILNMLLDHIQYLFRYNANVFIMPNLWFILSDSLHDVLLDSSKNASKEENEEIRRQLELVAYRNESLMLNMKYDQSERDIDSSENRRRDQMNKTGTFKNRDHTNNDVVNFFEGDKSIVKRSASDILEIIERLDKLQLSSTFSDILRPALISSSISTSSELCLTLKLMIHWCVTKFRDESPSSENALIIANFLKRKVIQNTESKNKSSVKIAFENEILEIIFDMVENADFKIHLHNLYVFINELYQLKIFTISSYLRKSIASGIFYTSPENPTKALESRLVRLHIEIIKNLPVLNNKQCDSILRKISKEDLDFKQDFEIGQQILRQEFVESILENKLSGQKEENLRFIKELKVGLKFLLINWLTTELKKHISESPRLVRLDPCTIANLYTFYSLCDNLAVFFKVLLKFILRNEGKIIIYYLDTLYLISRLIVRHFKLIKSISGTTLDSSNTIYELFKLLISSYKDLISRDINYYNFGEIWYFIDNNVDIQEVRKGENDDLHGVDKLKQLSRSDTDSPMRLNYGTLQANKDNFSNFKQEVSELIASCSISIDTDKLKDLISLSTSLGNKTLNQYLNAENTEQVLKHYFNNFNSISTEQEGTIIQFLLNIGSCTKERIDIGHTLAGLQSHELNTSGRILPSNFLRKLIEIGICQAGDLAHLIECFIRYEKAPKEEFEVEGFEVFCETLFGNHSENDSCRKDQGLLLEMNRNAILEKKNPQISLFILKCLKRIFSAREVTILQYYKCHFYHYLRRALLFDSTLIAELIFEVLTQNEIICLMNELLFFDGPQVRSYRDFDKLSLEMNEFSLPFCQILLKIVLEKDRSLEIEENDRYIDQSLESLLNSLKFHFSARNSYFGELFKFLRWDYKVRVMAFFQRKFLQSTNFDFPMLNAENRVPRVALYSENGKVNLLPVFEDFFKKFSVYATYSVPTSEKDFEDMFAFLIKLKELTKFKVTYDDDTLDNIHQTISTFLRVLIIHKLTSTNVILQKDITFLFIKNLVSLLNSEFMSNSNEKLKILLYDLLLLMKGSLNSAMILQEKPVTFDSPKYNARMGLTADDSPRISELNFDSKQLQGQNSDLNFSSNVNLGGREINRCKMLNSIFNLPELNCINSLKRFVDDSKIKSALMLDNQELAKDADIHVFNDPNLLLESIGNNPMCEAFSIIDSNHQAPAGKVVPFRLKSYEILDALGTSLNDTCINMLLFDSFTTRENPP